MTQALFSLALWTVAILLTLGPFIFGFNTMDKPTPSQAVGIITGLMLWIMGLAILITLGTIIKL